MSDLIYTYDLPKHVRGVEDLRTVRHTLFSKVALKDFVLLPQGACLEHLPSVSEGRVSISVLYFAQRLAK